MTRVGRCFGAALAPFALAAQMHLYWDGPGASHLGAPSANGAVLSCLDADTGDLALRDLSSGKVRRLTSRKTAGEFAYFSVPSRDGARVAYAWFNESGFYDLRVVGADAGEPKVLFRSEEAGFVQPVAWSPDNRWVLTLLFRKDNISQIALAPAEGGEIRVLKSLNWVYPKKMDFSPDGRWIVYDSFARDGESQRDLFILSVDGSSERRFVESKAEDLFPVWDPGGERIYFASDRSGKMDLWAAPVRDGAAAGDPVVVARDLGRILPMGVTREGRMFLGLRNGGSDIFVADWDGGFRSKPVRIGEGWSPAWSADGRRLAWLVRRGAENYGQDARAIVVRDAEGKDRAVEPKLAHMETLRWSADGAELLVSGSDARGRGGLFAVDVETGRTKPVMAGTAIGFRGLAGADVGGRRLVANGASLVEGDKTVASVDAAVEAVAASERVAALIAGGRLWIWDGKAVRRAGDSAGWSAVAWSGGKLLAIRDSEFWLVDPKGGSARAAKAAAPVGSVDVRAGRIAFAAGGAKSEVWALDLPR